MATYRIPNQEKKITQPNIGEIFGELWSSYNLDLHSNKGKIRASKRMIIAPDTAGTAPTDVPIGFVYHPYTNGDSYWTVAGTKVFSAASLVASWDVDAITSSPTDCSSDYSDIITFNGNLVVSRNSTSVSKLATSGNWSNAFTASGAGTPHLMTVYASRLYITGISSGYIVGSCDASFSYASSGTNTINIGSEQAISCMRSASNRIWFSTINSGGGKGFVYEWDGVNTNAIRRYRLDSSGAVSMIIKDDIPYIMDTFGNLQQFNGSGFVTVARLPVDDSDILLRALADNSNLRYMHPNGMSIIEGRICALINTITAKSATPYYENMPAGIWEYEPTIGLIHKHSPSYKTLVGGVTDWGQMEVAAVGGLAAANSSSSDTNKTRFLAGVTQYTDISTTLPRVLLDDFYGATEKKGYFVTSQIQASELTENWKAAIVKYTKMGSLNDFIRVKYRTEKATPTYISITWTSTTTFTTSTDISSLVGYECEILRGKGAGATPHIASVTGSGTYTVTLDETITGATSTGRARIQNWKNFPVISNITETNETMQPQGSSSWIEFKVALTGTGIHPELEELIISTEVQQKITI